MEVNATDKMGCETDVCTEKKTSLTIHKLRGKIFAIAAKLRDYTAANLESKEKSSQKFSDKDVLTSKLIIASGRSLIQIDIEVHE